MQKSQWNKYRGPHDSHCRNTANIYVLTLAENMRKKGAMSIIVHQWKNILESKWQELLLNGCLDTLRVFKLKSDIYHFLCSNNQWNRYTMYRLKESSLPTVQYYFLLFLTIGSPDYITSTVMVSTTSIHSTCSIKGWINNKKWTCRTQNNIYNYNAMCRET